MRPTGSVESEDLHVRESGRGAPLVLVHGWATSSAVWGRGLLERLSATRRCLAVDLRGHGAAPAPPDPFTLRDHGADLARLVARRGLERPALLGWSMGAQIALEAAALLGHRLAALILVAGTARFPSGPGYPHGLAPREVEGLTARLTRGAPRALRRFFAGMFAHGELPEERRRVVEELADAAPDPASALAALAALAAADARPLLGSIRSPVLLIHGERDPIVPASASRFLAERLPSSRLEVLAGAGHVPFLTCADRFHTLTSGFLDAQQ